MLIMEFTKSRTLVVVVVVALLFGGTVIKASPVGRPAKAAAPEAFPLRASSQSVSRAAVPATSSVVVDDDNNDEWMAEMKTTPATTVDVVDDDENSTIDEQHNANIENTTHNDDTGADNDTANDDDADHYADQAAPKTPSPCQLECFATVSEPTNTNMLMNQNTRKIMRKKYVQTHTKFNRTLDARLGTEHLFKYWLFNWTKRI